PTTRLFGNRAYANYRWSGEGRRRLSTLALAVIGRRTVLATVMFVDETGRGARRVGFDRAHAPLEPRDVFERLRVLDRFERVSAPRERPMVGDEYRRHLVW